MAAWLGGPMYCLMSALSTKATSGMRGMRADMRTVVSCTDSSSDVGGGQDQHVRRGLDAVQLRQQGVHHPGINVFVTASISAILLLRSSPDGVTGL